MSALSLLLCAATLVSPDPRTELQALLREKAPRLADYEVRKYSAALSDTTTNAARLVEWAVARLKENNGPVAPRPAPEQPWWMPRHEALLRQIETLEEERIGGTLRTLSNLGSDCLGLGRRLRAEHPFRTGGKDAFSNSTLRGAVQAVWEPSG